MSESAPHEIRRISDTARHWARQAPEREAIVFGERRLTYPDLAGEIDRCARALLASGIAPGDRVALLATSRPEYLITFLASARIGAIWLGLNPRYRLEELAYVVGDARPKLLLGQDGLGDRPVADLLDELARRTPEVARTISLGASVEDESTRLPGFERWLDEGEASSAEQLEQCAASVEPTDVCLIVYTSGSTGRPKGAMLTHHGLVHCSTIQADRWPTSRPPRIVNNFPINHVACTGDICAFVLVAGGAIVFQEAFDPAATLRAVERERCNAWGGVPTMLQLCVAQADFDRYDLSSVERIIWSGAAAPRPLLERLSRLGATLHTSYGMTETTGSVTYSDDGADLDTLAETVGRPDPRYEVRIVREDGADCAAGEEGEIRVRGAFLMTGYFERPEATAEALDADGWLHTGDLGVVREDGNIRLVGRLSEMFKSGGYNVYPREVEMALEEHPAVAMAAVVGVPDALFQEVGHAFVLPATADAPSAAELEAFCRERLANYKVPKRIVVEQELPMLPVGKIDKVALRTAARAALGGDTGDPP